MTARLRASLVAAASFVAGFAVAELTGVRALGGLVLLAGAVWCAREGLAIASRTVVAGLIVGLVLLFAVSHLLGLVLGAWPAVLVSAVAAGIVVWLALRSDQAPAPLDGQISPLAQ